MLVICDFMRRVGILKATVVWYEIELENSGERVGFLSWLPGMIFHQFSLEFVEFSVLLSRCASLPLGFILVTGTSRVLDGSFSRKREFTWYHVHYFNISLAVTADIPFYLCIQRAIR